MGIIDEDIARVRDSTDLVSLVGEQVTLKRVGQRYVGLCPFHQEKTPSFGVNPTLGIFHCLSGDTRVITWEGIREIRELAGGTHKILTSKGRWVDAPFYSFGEQPLMKLTLSRNRVEKTIYATADHRWLLRTDSGLGRERTTSELRKGSRLAWSFPQGGAKQVRPSAFGIARGITFGDGSRFNKGAAVDLHGDKNLELLKWFPLSHSYACRREHKGIETSYLKVVDLPAYFKDLPSLNESPSYLVGWLAGYFAADGCVAKDGTVMLNSSKRENLEFVRLLCARLGLGTYGITEQLREGLPGRSRSSLYRIHFINEDLREEFFLISEHRFRFNGTEKRWARRGWVVKSVEPANRSEEVFCAVVPGSHSFALEDNILTGNCFGCQKSGDAITWVRETEHLDFVDAVERLAQRAGIQLRYDDRSQSKDRSRKGRLSEAVGAAIDFYHRLLLEDPQGGGARKYLRSRGFDGDAARQFLLGWAPDGWDALSRWLQQERKFSRDDIVDAGLAFVNKANRLQDQFRGRLMFPIHDARGDPAGFGGRSLTDDGPKYKNSPDSVVYQKSRLLYGLHRAKETIVARGDVVICEGYTDVMAYALAGAPNAIATCGTALADDHVKLLKNLTRNITLAYDSDAAGQGAAGQWYRWEQTYDLSVRVADLPPGQDPGDLWTQDRPRLVASLEHAQPFLRFRLDRALAAADLSTLEGRGRAAGVAAAIVAEHPSELVRDQYVMELAERLQIDADTLRGEVARAKDHPPARKPERNTAPPEGGDVPPPPPPLVVDRREVDLLRWVIHEPEVVADWLDEPLLLDPTAREAYELLMSTHDFHEAIAAAQGPVRELLERLAVEEPTADDERPVMRARLLVNTVAPVAQHLLEQLLRDGDDGASAIKADLDLLAHAREVGEWDAARDVAERLVGWVVEAARASAPEVVEQSV